MLIFSEVSLFLLMKIFKKVLKLKLLKEMDSADVFVIYLKPEA
jgi:hypothetical protein